MSDDGEVALSTADIARSAVHGTVIMLARQVVSVIASFVGGIVLARSLSPAEFGVYALLAFLNNAASVVTDLGLNATLVRQGATSTSRDRAVVFTPQAVVAVGWFALLCLVAPVARDVGPHVSDLAQAIVIVGAAGLLMPLSGVALAVLESRLAFREVGLVLLSQTLTFNVVAAVLAAKGSGVVAPATGFLASGVLSTGLALVAARYRPRLTLDRRGLGDRLRYGIPFVGGTAVSVLKDSVTPLFIGLAFGASAAGYINWAQTLAIVGMLLLFPLARVFFPVFSRLRESPGDFALAVRHATYWSYALAAPLTVFIAVNVRAIATTVYGDQWVPALSLVLWLSAANVLSPVVGVLFVAENVLGRPGVTLRYTVGYFVATWTLVPIASAVDGYHGYGWANLLVTLVGLPLVLRSRHYFLGRWAGLLGPWLAAALAIGGGRLLVDAAVGPITSLGGLVVLFAVSAVGYLAVLALVGRSYLKLLWSLRTRVEV